MASGTAGFHNAAVRAARLLQQKKHRQEQRCFLIEGVALLSAAVAAKHPIRQVFVQADARLEPEIREQLSALPVLTVDARTLASLAQTRTPAGIIAVVGFIERDVGQMSSVLRAEGKTFILVLPDLADPGNAGTLVRSAEAFGCAAVCFGPHAVDPYNDKVVRASMGSLFRVPLLGFASWADFVGAAQKSNLNIVAAQASGSDVRSVTIPHRAALVIGQERHGFAGISPSDIQLAVAVPQRPSIDSLNAGVAGSLLMYEVSRALGLLTAQTAGTNVT